MTTITRIRTEHDARLYVEADTDASVLDCFLVTLCPYVPEPGLLVHRDGVAIDALWADALATVTYLRAQPWNEVAPPAVFQPWATITARNCSDVARESELRMQMMIGDGEPLQSMAKRYPVAAIGQFHEERVAALCRALDLINGARPVATSPWPDFKGLN